MSDHSTGPVPDDTTSDPALERLLRPWESSAPETIDVELALSRVTARRRAEPVAAADDLAVRRAAKTAARTTTVPIWRRRGVRAAAVLALVGTTALWQYARGRTDENAALAVATPTGSSKTFRLADGTQVRLGPSSSIQMDAGFGSAHRKVTLHGEAWFAVTHNAALPFSITVGRTTVEDIGTAFLVRESPSREVSVRVAEGAVRITTPAMQRDSSVVLGAGDGAVATSAGITVAAGAVTASEADALSSGRLTFHDASLVEVHDALERWYGVKLLVRDSALAARHVTADFTSEPVSRVAAVLGLTLGVAAESHGDTIELRSIPGMPTRP